MRDDDVSARIADLERENRILRRKLERCSESRAQLELHTDKDRAQLQTLYCEMVERRELLDRVLAVSPTAVGWKDSEGRYLGCNRAYAQALGLTDPEAVVGHTDEEIVPAEEIAMWTDGDVEARQGAYPPSCEVLWRHADGDVRMALCSKVALAREDGQVLGTLAQYHDVSAHRAAELALVAAHEQMEATLSVLPDALLEFSREEILSQFHISRSDPLYSHIRGRQGHPLTELFPIPVVEVFRRAIVGAEGSGAAHGEIFSLLDLEGKTRWFELSVARHRQGTRYVTLVREVTARVLAEAESRRLEAEMLHTQKLESLGVLAGGIAHDFNNILTSILGNADLARQDLGEGEVVASCLESIELGSRRAADLCDQLLAYTGKGHFVVRAVNLTALVRETLTLVKVGISKKAEIHLHLDENLPLVLGDRSQLQQVLLNLVVNASDALEDREGSITLTTRNEHLRRPRRLSGGMLAAGDYVALTVQDTGIGMSAETLARIFDPFFTTKFTGRGLGLAATLGIIGRHQGGIGVNSHFGMGTTFSLLLPCAKGALIQAEIAHSNSDELYRGTVLLADDEAMVRKVTARMLERMGMKVLTAADGREAVEIVAAHAGEIGLLMLDLTMPRLGGVEAYEEISAIQPGIPTILSSGFSTAYTAQSFESQGITGFLHKPYSLEQLRAVLREVLRIPHADR